jgi:hypothetical protein
MAVADEPLYTQFSGDVFGNPEDIGIYQFDLDGILPGGSRITESFEIEVRPNFKRVNDTEISGLELFDANRTARLEADGTTWTNINQVARKFNGIEWEDLSYDFDVT